MTKTQGFLAPYGSAGERANSLESPSIKAMKDRLGVRERRMHRLAAFAIPINRLDGLIMKSQSDPLRGRIVASLSPKRLPNRHLSGKALRSYCRQA